MASFYIKLLSLLKSTGVLSNFPIPNLSTLLFKLLKLLDTFLFYQYLIYLHQILN